MSELNPQQRDVMFFIQERIVAKGEAPLIAEIALDCAAVASKTRAHFIVGQLVDLGYLARDPRQRRGLRVLKAVPDQFEEAAKAACEAGGIGPDKLSAVRDAIAQTLTRTA